MAAALQKVGRLPIALSLIIYGSALFADNLSLSQGSTALVLRAWPLLLVAFGVEYLARSLLAERKGAAAPAGLRFDFSGAFLLALIVGLSSGVALVQNWVQTASLPFSEEVVSRQEMVTLPADGVRQLQILDPRGQVEVVRSARSDQLAIEATHTVRGPALQRERMQAALEQFELQIVPGTAVTVTAKTPPQVPGTHVNYRIHLPPQLKLRVDTESGSIRVIGHTGKMHLTSQRGRITVEGGAGALSAASDMGGIGVRNFSGSVSARTVRGTIEVQQVQGAIRLETELGPVRVHEFSGPLTVETVTGHIAASSGAAVSGPINLQSQGGAVSLSVPTGSSLQAAAQTRHGGLTIPAWMQRTTSEAGLSAAGTLGQGLHQVELRSVSGSVVLNVR